MTILGVRPPYDTGRLGSALRCPVTTSAVVGQADPERRYCVMPDADRRQRVCAAPDIVRNDVRDVDIAAFNERSRRAFLRCGYVPWRRVVQAPGAKSAYVHDLVCRPGLFYGTAPVQGHPGSDRIRAADAPFGAAIVVYRRTPDLEVLLLHRAAEGPDHEGGWAWTPPAGARFPAEPIDDCAARELHEEIGVDLSPRPVAVDEAKGWALYVSEVSPEVPIQFEAEHDRYQ